MHYVREHQVGDLIVSYGEMASAPFSASSFAVANRDQSMKSWDRVIFVHDRIYNSVADYRSSRVGVGCRMSDVVCPLLFFFHDGITFERFELQS